MNSKSRSWLWWGMTSKVQSFKLVRYLNREEKTHSEEVGYDRVVVHICQISTSLYLNLSTFNGHSWMVWMATHWTDRSYLGKAKCKMKRQFHHLGDVWFIKVVWDLLSKVCIFEYKIWYKIWYFNNHFQKPKNYEIVFRFKRFPLLDGFSVNFKRGTFWTKICHFFLEDGPPNKHGNPWAA